MSFEIIYFKNNTVSIRDSGLGENMHSEIGPWEEAVGVYVAQANLVKRLGRGQSQQGATPVIIYDIGMGIAANALATIAVFRELGRELGAAGRRKLKIVSFEMDIAGIELALTQAELFPFLRAEEGAVRRLLEHGVYREADDSGGPGTVALEWELEWELKIGDFRREMAGCPAPELIYYDLFSPKTCPELWGYRTFQNLRERLGGTGAGGSAADQNQGLGTTLITYSSSTSVRSALLMAGFHVGYGCPTSLKRETTVAATRPELIQHPLDQKWYDRRARSHKPFPEDGVLGVGLGG